MKVWTNNDFIGFYPVGAAAIVVADTSEKAADLLNIKLKSIGLKPTAKVDDMQELHIIPGTVRILNDGDY